jgi:hypothetical protein
MPDENTITREALLEIRRELDVRSIPLKVCASKANVSYSTFLSWFPAAGTPQVPSLAALPGLARALPSDLLSLLVPDGFHIVPDPSGLDYDDFAAGCRAYLDAKDRAHHPDSPAGRDLAESEQAELDTKIAYLPIKGVVNA